MANIIKNPFALTNQEQEDIIVGGYQSTFTFAQKFLPDFSKSISPPAHRETFLAFDAPDTTPVVLICHRDMSKTTMTKALVLKKLLYAKKAKEWGLGEARQEFIGWSSSNQNKSQNNTSYVKQFIEHSDLIKYFFGNLKGKKWSAEAIETIYGDRLTSTSNISSLRGDTVANVETGAERYSIIVADDSENEANSITDSAREKFSSLIIKGMLPAIEKGQIGNKFIFINTPIHYAGFTQQMIELYEKTTSDKHLQENIAWKILFYPAIVPREEGKKYDKRDIVDSDILPQGIYNWKDRIDKEYLENSYHLAEQSPEGTSGFYQEYMLEVQSAENATFGRKYIKNHKGVYSYRDRQSYITIDGEDIPINCFGGCDPATDIDTKDSDFSVMLVSGIDAEGNVYVLHYERHKNIPTLGIRNEKDELVGKKGVVDHILSLYNSFHCRSFTVEDVAMTRSVFQGLNQRREILKNYGQLIIPIKPGGQEKINKIYTGLLHYFSAGKIFTRKSHLALEEEIIRFGKRMRHDDTIESLYFSIKNSYKPTANRKASLAKKKKRRSRPWYLR